MRRRTLLIAGVSCAAAWPVLAQAPGAKTHHILWVSTETEPDPFITGFRDGMRELGYVEGRNLAFVLRYAPGDPGMLRKALPEILSVPADLIVSSGPAILATHLTKGRPVLFAISGDPVELGIAESISRPGKNFTGMTFMSLELAQKRVQLLKELLPNISSLAILSQRNHPGESSEHRTTVLSADALSIAHSYIPFNSGAELDGALARVADVRADAMLVFPDGLTLVHRARIAEFARAQRLPSMFGWREYCESGGLASYGGNQRATYYRLAAYANRLLRGAKPADLPIERPTAFELVLNTKTARDIGVTVPASFLARANEVID